MTGTLAAPDARPFLPMNRVLAFALVPLDLVYALGKRLDD